MQRAGQVVSKAELLGSTSGTLDAVADLNVVEVYAGYVRRKIDAPFGRNALQTVRGSATGSPPTGRADHGHDRPACRRGGGGGACGRG